MFIQIDGRGVTAEQMKYGAISKSTFLTGKCLLYTVLFFFALLEKKSLQNEHFFKLMKKSMLQK